MGAVRTASRHDPIAIADRTNEANDQSSSPVAPPSLHLRPASGMRKWRVRVGRSYGPQFNTHHGQRNAELVARPLTPLARYSKHLESFAILEPGYDLIHSRNAVPIFTRTPFIVTYEDYLPRTPDDRPIPWLETYLVRRLAHPRCRAILAQSHYALRQMRHQHRMRPELATLMAKAQVLYPGVRPTQAAPKRPGDALDLLFVGRDFFRKGGPALVRAHKRLRAAGLPVNTTIVSSLSWAIGDYIGPPDPAGVEAARTELSADGITWFASQPNDRVRDMMRAADFFVMPTFHDTFGYVSVEALAAATPVIATDTCAQNEIVGHGQSGFLLDFDNDAEVGKWRWIYGQQRPGYSEAYLVHGRYPGRRDCRPGAAMLGHARGL